MIRHFLRCAVALSLAFAAPALALADVDLPAVETCLSESAATGQPPDLCIEAAQSACLEADEEAPAVATLCFVEAEKVWQGGIAALMAQISAQAPEEIAAIAGIETKYDLLSALLQCSRMEDLALAVGRASEAAILRQNARCKASAAALTHARLFLRSQDLR